MFAFTDADAKDYERIDEVRSKADAKKIKITTLLTGRCSKRRRRETRGTVDALNGLISIFSYKRQNLAN